MNCLHIDISEEKGQYKNIEIIFRIKKFAEADMSGQYRLVTRSDFDGLVCAVLFKKMQMVGDILFVHPKDVQDGRVELTSNDITTNLPFSPYVHMCFDHHLSETLRSSKRNVNHIINAEAPSAARVVYDYFGGKERFPDVSDDMMVAVDKSDTADFSMDEILEPSGWVLLSYLMDPRTGLGRFRNFRISNYELMMKMIELCGSGANIQEIIEDFDIQERVTLYYEHKEKAKAQLKEKAKIHGNLIELDLRDAEEIWATNRFTLYALFPQCNISAHIMWGLHKKNVVFAVGKSIVDRSSKVNVGEIMLTYGGGGHFNAGTCQVPIDHADDTQAELRKLLQG